MAGRIGSAEWSGTSLGPRGTWPAPLRTAVQFMLDCRQPVLVAWGPERTSLYNDAYIPLLGDRHPAALGRPMEEVWRDAWDEYGPLVDAALRGEAQYRVDRPVPAAGGTGPEPLWFTFSCTPLRDECGTVGGLLSVLTETTDAIQRHRASEAAHRDILLRSETRHRQLFDSIDQGFCVIELIFDGADRPIDYRFIDVNHAFERQTGLVNPVGMRMRTLVPGHEQHWFDTYGRIALTGEARRFALPAAQLGRYFEVYAFRVGAPEDRHVSVLFNDISERRRAEEHQTLLLAELDHRVKNVLAVVQSIVRQSLGDQGGSLDDDAVGRLSGRLTALARSHRLLADSRWEGAALRQLVGETVAAYRKAKGGERIAIAGADVQVTPRAAQSLTLAFHELTTNAAKYGALSVPGGRVSVDWVPRRDAGVWMLVLTWVERGGPAIVKPPERRGFGSRLIEATVAYELEGRVTVAYEPEGLSVTMELPLDVLSSAPVQPPDTAAAAPAALPRPGVGQPLTGRRILVVEDQFLVAAEIAAEVVAAGGAVIGPFAALAEALDAAETDAIDAASLDVNLDGDMVWPVAAALRRRGIPALFATGYSGTMAAPRSLADIPRLEKPLDAARIVDALAALLDAGTAACAGGGDRGRGERR